MIRLAAALTVLALLPTPRAGAQPLPEGVTSSLPYARLRGRPVRLAPTEARETAARPQALSPRLGRVLRAIEEGLRGGALAERLRLLGLPLEEGRLRVIITLTDESEEPTALGGVPVTAERRRGRRLQAWVTPDELDAIARDPRVASLRGPAPIRRAEIVSKGVGLTGAEALHDQHVSGVGVAVGIIDSGFQGYEALLGNELPASVTVESFDGYYGITGGGVRHGTGVAEVVHDMAPGADLYLVNYGTLLDFEAAVDWLMDQGVDLITTSTGTDVGEPLDGRGPMSTKANEASLAGVPFLAAAGNYGTGHWRGTFAESGYIGYHDFGDGEAVAPFGDGGGCYRLPEGFVLDVRMIWNDWGPDLDSPGSGVDYDLELYHFNEGADSWEPTGITSNMNQKNGGAPWEVAIGYAPARGCYGAAIRKVADDGEHTLDLFVDSVSMGLEVRVPAYSVISPCVGEHVQCVGATRLNDGLASYSSQGPAPADELTGETRTKPQFTAPTEVATESYAPMPFGGTSCAAPHAAGALALLLDLTGGDPELALERMREYAVDLGEPGMDDVFGHGRVRVGQCDESACRQTPACATCGVPTDCRPVASGQGCYLGGGCYDHGTINPINDCKWCDEARPDIWAPVTDGLPCHHWEDLCDTGTCYQGMCLVDGRDPACDVADTVDATDATSDTASEDDASGGGGGCAMGTSPSPIAALGLSWMTALILRRRRYLSR